MPTVDCVYRFKATGVITGSILGLLDEVTGKPVNVSSKDTEQYYPVATPENQAKATEYATFLFTGGSIEFQGYTQG